MNQQISFRPTAKTIERLDRMTKIRKPMDQWANGRPSMIRTRAELITEYVIEGLARDEAFCDYMDSQADLTKEDPS